MRFTKSRFASVLLCTLALSHAQAAAPHRPAPPVEKQPRPYLLHIPGIGGLLRMDSILLAGLQTGGLDADYDTFDWTCQDPGLNALVNLPRNRQQAQLIADKIARQYRANPRQPILITCHSGGAGLVAWALEKLPDDVTIDTLLFLAPALSPRYDLSQALKHVKNKAYVFYSPNDPIVGAGTKAFGTIDRVRTEAAGSVGFTRPDPADEAAYAKLVPMPYQDAWMQQGNVGDHIGPMARRFAQLTLAPLLGAPAVAVDTTPTTQPASPAGAR
jgi:hypothetical protein